MPKELANSGMNACSVTLLRRWAGFAVVTLETHVIFIRINLNFKHMLAIINLQHAQRA